MPNVLVATTVNSYSPSTGINQERTPLLARLIFASGFGPAVIAHAIGVVPLAVSTVVKGLSILPPSKGLVVMIGGAPIVILKGEVEFVLPLVTVTVKLNVPNCVGVPDNTPVVPLKINPGGKELPACAAHAHVVVNDPSIPSA